MDLKTKRVESILSRREWLSRSMQLSIAGTLTVLAAGCQKNEMLVCADPAKLSDAENSLRESLHYSEESARSGQACMKCGFFERAATDACGNCKLLKGPVNPGGRCDSWSAAKT